MPIIKSAKKRVRQTNKARTRNAVAKNGLRAAIKSFQAAINGKKNVEAAVSSANSALDKAAKKGLMHKNKVARKKRQLAIAAKNSGAKVTKKVAKPVVAKKPVAKKTPVKSVVAKKPVAKKAPAKKPVAKKK